MITRGLVPSLFFCGVLLPAAPANAQEDAADAVPDADLEQGGGDGDDDDDDDDVFDASDCPFLFGDDDTHAQNLRYRKPRLVSVEKGETSVAVIHAVPRWGDPARVRITGLNVQGVEDPDADAASDEDAAAVALVSIDDTYADVCPVGVYAISADDALGQTGQVLAVFDDGLLVEQDGVLGFIPASGIGAAPTFRMIWRSSYDVVIEEGGGGGGERAKKASKKRSKRKNKRKKKSGRKR